MTRSVRRRRRGGGTMSEWAVMTTSRTRHGCELFTNANDDGTHWWGVRPPGCSLPLGEEHTAYDSIGAAQRVAEAAADALLAGLRSWRDEGFTMHGWGPIGDHDGFMGATAGGLRVAVKVSRDGSIARALHLFLGERSVAPRMSPATATVMLPGVPAQEAVALCLRGLLAEMERGDG